MKFHHLKTLIPSVKRIGTLNRLSSNVPSRFEDPRKYVAGVSREDLETNPALLSFFEANFPDPSTLPEPILSAADKKNLAQEAAHPLNFRPLSCFKRDMIEEEGTRACNKLRAKKMIPGLIYGHDPTKKTSNEDSPVDNRIFVKTLWQQLHRELDRYGRNFESRIYELTLFKDGHDTEGTTQLVMPRDVQRHPVQNKVYCVNYLRYYPGITKIKVPVAFINEEESPVLKRGGFIVPINRFVECTVEEGVPIPEKVEVECTGLQKEVVRFDRLIFPDGVHHTHMVDPASFNIGVVFGKQADDDENGAEAEGEEKIEEK